LAQVRARCAVQAPESFPRRARGTAEQRAGGRPGRAARSAPHEGGGRQSDDDDEDDDEPEDDEELESLFDDDEELESLFDDEPESFDEDFAESLAAFSRLRLRVP
jgi:hypothetical protein